MKRVSSDQPQQGQVTETVRQDRLSCGRGSSLDQTVEVTHHSAAGTVPRVDTRLKLTDHLGTWKTRWGFGGTPVCIGCVALCIDTSGAS